VYYRNDSEKTIEQTLGLKDFTGIEVFRKTTELNDQGMREIKHTLKPHEDELIILKRTLGGCSYTVPVRMRY